MPAETRYSAVLVAAHPDDEVIGAGAQLARLADGLTIVHVTDGAPRDMRDAASHGFGTRREYARARRGELAAALALAGIGLDRTCSMDVPDQDASLHLPRLALRLAGIFRRLRPDVVMTHPYEGGHPDHDATAFAVHAACRQLDPAPTLVEFTSYHARGAGVAVFEFLPANGTHVATTVLTPEERDLKRRMLDCFVTQRRTLEMFPTEVELSRVAPRYDFSQPPHAGSLYYDRFEWGMKSARWLELAREALQSLGIEGPM